MQREVLVKASHAGRIDVAAGQLLEITNVEGEQVCDLFAFSKANVREALSPAHCRSCLGRVTLQPGDRLVSVLRRPMLEIVEDSCGRNDIMAAACDPERYRIDFGVGDHRSCRMNLAEAMAPEGIPYAYLPDSVNLFQNSPAAADGTVMRGRSPSRPGDRIVLRALMDLIVVGSACPQDLSDLNGFHVTDIRIRVRDPRHLAPT